MLGLQRFTDGVRMLKRDPTALEVVTRDPRTPSYVRVLAGAVAAYALSPFDLIPDFIPILGYLDDLRLVPAGIALVRHLVPAEVMTDCREKAAARAERPISRVAAAVMIGIWLAWDLGAGVRAGSSDVARHPRSTRRSHAAAQPAALTIPATIEP